MFEREMNPENVRKAEIVVGLASFNEADSIAFPTQQASLGLKKYYGDKSSAILNCDNHSPDGTEAAFFGTETEVPKIYVTTPPNLPGKGYNFQNMFRKILELDAKILVCLDADLLSVTPEWIKYFVDPIQQGFDFVNPMYSRHKYDGTITKNICYPLVYGLFCRNIRQPIGGDFAMSGRFARHVLCQLWHRTTQEYGIDIFLSMSAITGGFKQCNTGLGAKVHKPSAPKLGPMFVQVVSTSFMTILRNFDKWRKATEIDEPALFGLKKLDLPQDLKVDRKKVAEQAYEAFEHYQATLEEYLTPSLYADFTRMFTKKRIDIGAEVWCTAVYDAIAGFRAAADGTMVAKSLRGLYFGRVLSFMKKTWSMSSDAAEDEILAQAKVFHAQRDYLIRKLEMA